MASQSDIAEYDVPHFTGESAEEAQDFIQAVNKRAYAAGKQKDSAWIADFAYPFFSRNALVWYEDLDEGIQNDWKLLKRAILAEFTRRQPAPSTVPSAAPAGPRLSSRDTPAAPPPPAPTKMIGHIRLASEVSNCVGYLTVPETWPRLGVVCANINEASVFEADILGRTLTGEEDSLVTLPNGLGESLFPGTNNYGYIVRSSSENRAKQWSSTWSIGGHSNTVTSLLQEGGRQCDAKFVADTFVHRSGIFVPADIHKFLAGAPRYTALTLHFEPVT
ncbi:hypothetical protein M407DRAFT_32372 [Tulasnella calospora MUT 4182]|uniref:Uncharacterized protein n=1 Tax=Tulasnella calospora MUT 4182 TaxID=1051891 RepID=A0A0C3K981_9AGAM|nr:hypothetical protein M407DRAFT_32372 [Tulasnella calospora MUT 4182]